MGQQLPRTLTRRNALSVWNNCCEWKGCFFMTYLSTCWIEHSSSSSLMQTAMLDIAYDVFMHLDWGAKNWSSTRSRYPPANPKILALPWTNQNPWQPVCFRNLNIRSRPFAIQLAQTKMPPCHCWMEATWGLKLRCANLPPEKIMNLDEFGRWRKRWPTRNKLGRLFRSLQFWQGLQASLLQLFLRALTVKWTDRFQGNYCNSK